MAVVEQDRLREVARVETRLESIETRPGGAVVELAGREERGERLVPHVRHSQTVLDRRGGRGAERRQRERGEGENAMWPDHAAAIDLGGGFGRGRSEERRVGKEW